MSTVTWRASGGGDWDISADWSSDPSLPGSGDAVVVATPGAATITHSQGADDSAASISFSAIDSLTISAGSLTVAGASSIGGTLTLAGGTLELDGDTTVGSLAQAGGLLSGTGTVTVTGPAVLGLSNSFIVEAGSGITDLKSGGSLGGNGVSPFLGLDGGRVLENEGVFAWHSGQISLAANFLGVSMGSATIDNVVGAIFDDQTDNTINANPIGTNLFINDGTFKKTAGTGTTNIAIPFNNSGTVEVDSGTLALNGGGASSGSITVASGTTLSFGAGSYAITGTLASPGTFQVSGANVSVAQDLTNAGLLNLTSGSLALGGNATLASLTQAGGLLSGTGTVTVTGAAVFGLSNSSIVEAGSGTTDLKAGGSLGGPGFAPGFGLDGGRVLENEGVFAWQSGFIDLGDNALGVTVGGATIDNAAGAVFDAQNDFSIVTNNIGTDLFINEGMFKKSAGIGTTTIGVTLNNTGTVEVDSGTLALHGGGSSSGSLTAANGTTLRFDGGSYSITGTVTSPGTFQVSGADVSVTPDLIVAGLLNLTGGSLALGGNATLASLAQAGGLLSGTGTVTVTGPAVFGLSNLSIAETGSGTTDLKAGGLLGGPGFAPGLDLDGGRILENEGVFAWQSGFIDLGDNLFGVTVGGATIVNAAGAVFDAQNDSSIVTNNIGTDLFINNGTLRKSAGAGTTRIAVTFNNTGTAEVDSGTLALTGAITGSGQFVIGADAQLELGSATGEAVTFNGANATLKLDSPASYTGTIDGFAVGDAIDLVGQTATGITHDATSVIVTLKNGGPLHYAIAGANSDLFAVVDDLNGGSNIIITGLNAPPQAVVPTAVSIPQAVLTPIAGIGVTDADASSENETIKVVLTDSVGQLLADTTAPGGGGTIISNLAGTQMTITGSLDQVNADLSTLRYFSFNEAADSIDFATSDSRGATDDNRIAVTVGENLPPVATLPVGAIVQVGVLTPFPGLSIEDPDAIAVGETITVRLDGFGQSNGFTAFVADTGAPGGGGTITGSASASLAISGTLDQVNADLTTLQFENSEAGTSTIQVTSDDGRGPAFSVQQFTVSVNAPPVTTVPPNSLLVEQNVPSRLTGISVFDLDAVSAGEILTVTLSDTNGVFFATTGALGGGGTISPVGATQLTIAGTLDQVNADLSTLTYLDQSDAVDSIDVATNDGRGASNDHRSFVIVTNAPPVLAIPGTQTAQQGIALPLTAISIADADATVANETFDVFIADTFGQLSANTGAPGGGGTILNILDNQIEIRGTLDQVNADLSTLAFLGGTPAADTIGIEVADQRTGLGGGFASGTITVNVVNAPPVISAPTSIIVQQGASTSISDISITDTDAVRLGERIGVDIVSTLGGELAADTGAAGGGAISGSHLIITGTINEVNADLSTLRYVNGSAGVDTITIDASDGEGPIVAQSLSISVNAPPVTTAPSTLTVAPDVATAINGISILDPDALFGNEVFSVDLTDSGGLLSVTAAALHSSVISPNHLRLSGTLAEVNFDLLSAITYFNVASGNDSIDVAVSDGRGGSDDRQVNVTINTPPVISAPTLLAVSRNVPAGITGIGISDTDAVFENETVTVLLFDTLGQLSATGIGTSGLGTSASPLTITGSIDQVNADLATLTYLNTSPFDDTIDVTASDGRGGADHREISVSDNVAPVIASPGALTFTSSVGGLIANVSVSDSDALIANERFHVFVSDKNKIGKLSAPGGGTSGSGTNFLSIVGSLSQVNSALANLTYLSNGVGPDPITIVADDGRGAGAERTISVEVLDIPPVTTVPGGVQSVPSTVPAKISGISITDADAVAGDETIVVTLTDTQGSLSVDTSVSDGGGTIRNNPLGTQLSISGTLAQVNADLSTLTDSNTGVGLDDINIFTDDGRGGTDSDIIAVSVTNAPPVTSAPLAQTLPSSVSTAISGISVADADAVGASEIITVTLSDSKGQLAANAGSKGGGGTIIIGPGATQIEISGTLDQVNADLSTLTYRGNSLGHDVIDVQTDDGRGGFNDRHIDVTIVPVAVTSLVASPANADLNANKIVTLTIQFSRAVTVTGGVPTLTLNDGGTATFTHVSGTNALIFSYSVAAGQNTSDLAVLAFNPNGATVRDGAGDDADESAAIANPAGILQIDTTAPTVTSIVADPAGGDLGANNSITLTVNFSEAVTVGLAGGSPTLRLNDGGIANFVSGSGTSALTFSYSVAAGENTADLAVAALPLHGATIRDNAGNNADLTGAATQLTGVLRIDTKPPSVTSVVAGPADGDLGVGGIVTLTVNFDDRVRVGSITPATTPTLLLNDGGDATFAGGSGSSALEFTYTVAAGQNIADLAATGGLALNGATIRDFAGNDANVKGAGKNPAGILRIDGTAPTVSSIVFNPAAGDLDSGKTVKATVKFSEAVTVTGTPTLTLDDGGTASFTGGSGSSALIFSYVVAAGQSTADLTVTGLALDGATIQDAAGNNADLAGATTNPAGILRVDTTAPTVTSVAPLPQSGDFDANGNGDLRANEQVLFSVDLDEAVTVTGGQSTLALNDGGIAHFQSVSTHVNNDGTSGSELTFIYTVLPGQNIADLAVNGLFLNGGTFRDAAGNNADLPGAATNPAGILQIDTTAPTVSSVVANPASGDLGVGKTVTLAVNFSEAVTVAGAPTLTLNDGGTATLTGGSGTTLSFTYVVGAGENIPDLAVKALTPNGATIEDGAGNDAVLTGAASNPVGTLKIDTTAPTVSSVVTNPASGDLDAGNSVILTVNFSEAVTATGAPILTLSDGGTATLTGGSGTAALTFTYVVAAGQNTADLAVAGLALNGGTIEDGAGNAAVLAGAVRNPAGILKIDTTAPTVTQVVSVPGTGEVTTGHIARLTLLMSEAVGVSGSPILLLNDGGTASFDAARSSPTTLAFDYAVASGQVTTDLRASGIELPSTSSIHDLAGNNANLSAAGADIGLQINTNATGPAGPSGGDFTINGGTEVELFGASSASVSFAPGGVGTLELDASSQFTGKLSGFAGQDVIDLFDVDFGANTTLGYSADKGNTGGTLSVGDGAHIANIALLGQYMASQFAVSSDGHGGTLVTEPPPAQQQFMAQPHA